MIWLALGKNCPLQLVLLTEWKNCPKQLFWLICGSCPIVTTGIGKIIGELPEAAGVVDHEGI